MSQRVLDVGNCVPDHTALTRFFQTHFPGTTLVRAHGLADALAELQAHEFALVVVNRKLDRDYADGLDVIQHLKADPAAQHVPMMLITNYPEYQAAAVQAGCAPGFGKSELEDPATVARVQPFLS
ncbi:MAG TPA: response regulator [Pirellulales bacterium]|jgi:CheY-like chemotaxis protein|nr:response regulator [Pirellulales bacterium]